MMMGGGRGPAMMLQTEVSKPQNVGATLARFWQYFSRYKLVLAFVATLILVSTYVQVLAPDLLGQAVDCYITPATQQALGSAAVARSTNCWWTQLGAQATPADYIAGLGGLVLLLAALQIAASALTGLLFYMMSYAGQNVLRRMRIDIFA